MSRFNNTSKALLLIDPQNDFCDPENGALGVPGAPEDCEGIASLISGSDRFGEMDSIYITLDSHYPIDIAHPHYWVGADGHEPAPLTQITYQDILDGKWIPRFDPAHAKNYVKQLEDEGKFTHMIWPVHCVIGSWGFQIQNEILNALKAWTVRNNKNFFLIQKGMNPRTEHFGAFRAQVPEHKNDRFNKNLRNELIKHDEIFVAGEAESHCVNFTLDQIKNDKKITEKLNICDDLMSPVPGFEGVAKDTQDECVINGAALVGS